MSGGFVINDAATGAGSVAAADITDAGTTGVALVQAESAAEARAELADATTYAFASATGVTLENGSVGGNASVTGGVLRLTVPATPAARHYDGIVEAPYGEVAVPRDATGRQPIRWRARVRVAAVGAGAIAYFLAVRAGGWHRAGFYVWSNGSGRSEDNSAPSGYGSSAWSAGVLPTNGTGWLEIEVNGSVGTYRYGTGTTTAPPETWTTHATVTLPAVDTYPTVRMVGASNTAPGTPSSVDFDNLTIEAL